MNSSISLSTLPVASFSISHVTLDDAKLMKQYEAEAEKDPLGYRGFVIFEDDYQWLIYLHDSVLSDFLRTGFSEHLVNCLALAKRNECVYVLFSEWGHEYDELSRFAWEDKDLCL